jgi:hypothetical protein
MTRFDVGERKFRSTAIANAAQAVAGVSKIGKEV